jgi:hypothetical protein
MTIVGNIFLVLSSNSDNSTGNSSVFTQTLAEPLLLNNGVNYEVCLVDYEFPTPTPYTNKTINITADICVMSDINGNLDRYLGRTMINMPTLLQQEQIKIKNISQDWVRLSKTSFDKIDITIKDSDNVGVPSGNSSLTICIRQVEIY